MGDQGELYVPEVFVELYRDHMLQLADVVTPNQTEAEYVPVRRRDCCNGSSLT